MKRRTWGWFFLAAASVIPGTACGCELGKYYCSVPSLSFTARIEERPMYGTLNVYAGPELATRRFAASVGAAFESYTTNIDKGVVGTTPPDSPALLLAQDAALRDKTMLGDSSGFRLGPTLKSFKLGFRSSYCADRRCEQRAEVVHDRGPLGAKTMATFKVMF